MKDSYSSKPLKCYGIGRKRCMLFLQRKGMTSLPNSKFFVSRLFLVSNLKDNLVLKKKKADALHLFKAIGNYRGRRLKLGLPLNGQRTKTNARTRKRFRLV